MSNPLGPPPAPRATYRLQFNAGFRFEDARRIVPYLAALGVSHVYASPVFMARAGSTHGYDAVDPNRLNPEIGDMAAFEAFVAELHRHGMGLVLDFVPNHMGVGPDNPWWVDILEWGRRSPYAGYFDIDWQGTEPTLAGKIVLPVLGDHYGAVLERGELRLRFDAALGAFAVAYYDSTFPLAPRHYRPLVARAAQRSEAIARHLAPALESPSEASRGSGRAALRRRADLFKRELAKAASGHPVVAEAISAVLDELNGDPERPKSFDALHRILEQQAYRLAFWRVAAHEINYRRFVDINDLAGLRMERQDLFEACHGLIRDLIERGMIQGLRLDHIDGLRDPEAYLRNLRAMARSARPAPRRGGRRAAPGGPRVPGFWILVEKILAGHESLRRDWPVEGTTGYDFMTQVNALFVNPAAEPSLTRLYERFTGCTDAFDDMVRDAKRLIMRESLASEISVVAHALHRLAKQNRRTRDYSLIACREALIHLVSHFPVYRTYITAKGPCAEDRRDLEWAFGKARKTYRSPDVSIFDFLHDVLTLDILKAAPRGYRRRDVLDVAARLQQYTGPVMAKAMEDTVFYRYVRMVALNEVGGEPAHFGVRPATLHRASQRRARELPFAMLATATHDHKRGEDVRARLNVLSEVPRDWGGKVKRWARMNARRKTDAGGRPTPSANDEYLLYQTILGAWPCGLAAPDFDGIEEFRDRVGAYMLKATREAKSETGWSAPDEGYENGVAQFVGRILDPNQSRPFLDDVAGFASRIAPAGAVNGLAQTVLKLTSPGVPDIYQGTETWDMSLVDPDNRRPVDYAALGGAIRDGVPQPAAALLATWRDGRIKQHVIRRVLELRRQCPEMFFAGSYEPVAVSGSKADNVIAFARRFEKNWMVVVVPRWVLPMIESSDLPLPRGWGTTALNLDAPETTWVDQVSGTIVDIGPDRTVKVSAILDATPVAVLRSSPQAMHFGPNSAMIHR